MTESLVNRLLAEQRRRLLATVLTAVEQEPDPKLRRDRIITAINVFYDFCRDVVKVGDEDAVRNEHALDLIAAVHASQVRLEAGHG